MTMIRRFRSRGLRYSQWLSISGWGSATLLLSIVTLWERDLQEFLFKVLLLLACAFLLYDTILDAFRWFEITDLGSHWGIRVGAGRRTRKSFSIEKSTIALAHVALTERVHGPGDGSEHVRIVIESLPFAKTTKDYELGERFHIPRPELEEICAMLNAGRSKP